MTNRVRIKIAITPAATANEIIGATAKSSQKKVNARTPIKTTIIPPVGEAKLPPISDPAAFSVQANPKMMRYVNRYYDLIGMRSVKQT